MALSNKFGALVLTTGNKSELAVGYCTLYGDMCGGLAVISDVPKTLVYTLSRVANRRHPGAIPENVFHEAAIGGVAARPEGHRLAARIRTPRPDSPRIRRGIRDAGERSWNRPARRSSWSTTSLTWWTTSEYKRQQAAPGLEGYDQGVRHRQAISRSHKGLPNEIRYSRRQP